MTTKTETPPSEIVQMLEDAIEREGLSVTDAATRSKVRRSFLSRLLNGHPPPREKDSRRSADTPDGRYTQLAEALNLNAEVFLPLIAKAQEENTEQLKEKRQKSKGKKKPPSPPKPTQEAEPTPAQEPTTGLSLAEDFKTRFPDGWKAIQTRQALRGDSNVMAIVEDVLDAKLGNDALRWKIFLRKRTRKTLTNASNQSQPGNFSEFNLHISFAQDAQTYLQIADELTDETGGVEEPPHIRDALTELARMIYEIACAYPDRG